MSKLNENFSLKVRKLFNSIAFLTVLLIVVSAAFGLVINHMKEPSAPCIYEKLNQQLLNEHSEISKYYKSKTSKHYELYYNSKFDNRHFLYFIFDKNHTLLDYDVLYWMPPEITVTSEGLIEVDQGIGTGVRRCKYYDPDNRLISGWFENPITVSNSMIVYMGGNGKWQLIVQYLFDKSVYFHTFDRDFSAVQYPVTQADFINNGKQLRITYKAGLEEHEVTETLDLYDKGGKP